jgi:polyferredoxin
MSTDRDKDAFRDTIATVNKDGGREWVYPKKPDGRYYKWRSYLSYVLLVVLFGLPWIKVNGEPLLLFNVLERNFIIFGMAFSPQDFHLFAIMMITAVVFIALFTVVFGRLFCGWICPQTIFMEMVFRKIEYWIEGDANAQRRLDKAPWSSEKIRKKVLKQGLFLLVSALIAHTFLAYIIGVDEVLATISQSPLTAPAGFTAIVIFIGVFYLVFANMREQVCIAICPYGRLQGVLLVDDSISVIYDYERGEPRGKIRREKKAKPKPEPSGCSNCENCKDGKDSCSDQILDRMQSALTADGHVVANQPSTAPASAPALAFSTNEKEVATVSLPVIGDCIECSLCVQVCPTGIDIRNGIQMECINCTACIDACDEVMDKIDRPRGLIRYDSERGVREKVRKIWTPRVFAYSAVLLALLALNIVLLGGRDGLDVLLMRTPGMLYQENTDGSINNLYNYQIVNKTGKEVSLRFEVSGGTVRAIGSSPIAKPGEVTGGSLFIDMEAKTTGYPDEVTVDVYSGDEKLKTISTTFIHPKN